MTLGDFIIKYIGQKVDFDKAYGAQCVDLARQYFQDVWGVPQPEGVGGAREFYINFESRPIQSRHMERIEVSTHGQFIPSGAVVIFRATGTNQYGHIGVCIRTEGNVIWLFEQDGFRQDGAKITAWSYNNVLGYLLKKEG